MYRPHYRVTMSGKLGGVNGAETFSCSFALANFDGAGLTGTSDTVVQPNGDAWTDLAADCAAWFSRPNSRIHPDALLQMVKIAMIGADGAYTSAPVERLVNVTGQWGAAGQRPPNQIAHALTLKTPGDLNRIKGRFFSPLPAILSAADGLIPDAEAELVEGSLVTFINAINNQPGFDVANTAVAVASQGRFNKNGTQRVQPDNHRVTSVGVGRVLDTIRARRNKLVEGTDFSLIA
jgi:hypothetical protein